MISFATGLFGLPQVFLFIAGRPKLCSNLQHRLPVAMILVRADDTGIDYGRLDQVPLVGTIGNDFDTSCVWPIV